MSTSNSNETQQGSRPRVELEILRGRAKNKIRRVDVPVFLIGSASDCDLVLADKLFPEVHTYLYVTPEGVSVRRLGTGPDLMIDDQVVQSSPVADGQVLRVGKYEFAVHVATGSKRDVAPVQEASPPVESLLPTEHAGVAMVRALLEDVKAMLRVEAGLKLYIEPPSPWQSVTSSEALSVRKASA